MISTDILVAQVPDTLHLARVRFGTTALSIHAQKAIANFFHTTWKGLVSVSRWVRTNIVEIIILPMFMYAAGLYEITQVCADASARWFMKALLDDRK